MTVEMLADRGRDILAALSQVIVGKAEALERILAALLANGHVLIEDYPGLAKTLIAQLFAQSLDLDFKRIQFTPICCQATSQEASSTNQREGRFEYPGGLAYRGRPVGVPPLGTGRGGLPPLGARAPGAGRRPPRPGPGRPRWMPDAPLAATLAALRRRRRRTAGVR
jgi:ATPase family associated with various cellular activities (AAA)